MIDGIKLINCSFEDDLKGQKIEFINFSIKKGETVQIESDSHDKSSLFLKGLATVKYPLNGKYIFFNEELNFPDYRYFLKYKKKIAYVGIDSNLVSRKTLKENIFLMTEYEKNIIVKELDEKSKTLCNFFNISEKLDKFPKDINLRKNKIVILIRELIKQFEIVLLDCPENFLGYEEISYIKNFIGDDKIIVFISYDKEVLKIFNSKTLFIN